MRKLRRVSRHLNATVVSPRPLVRIRREKTSMMVVVMTCLFFVFTLPEAIMQVFYSELQGGWSGGQLVIVWADSVAFTYHSLNFGVMLVTNSRFSTEFFSMYNSAINLLKIKSNHWESPLKSLPNSNQVPLALMFAWMVFKITSLLKNINNNKQTHFQ